MGSAEYSPLKKIILLNILFCLFVFCVAGQNIAVVPVWERNMECVSLLTDGSQMNSIYSSLKISS